MTIQVVILAAGQGKRMHSSLPKVLHSLAGKPLLGHVIATALKVAPDSKPVIVYGHEGEQVLARFKDDNLQFVEQAEQAGTGHAVQQALPLIEDLSRVLVLYGDVPLISENTLNLLIDKTGENDVGMVTAYLKNPQGYGRILRDSTGAVLGIVEEKDASEKERRITEVNSGIYLIPASSLKAWLPKLKKKNAQGEYYLTDIIPLAIADEMGITTVQPEHKDEIRGINDRMQLAHQERFYQRSKAYELMRQGVTILDPERLDIRGDVKIGRDVVLDVNVILEGNVVIGDECNIGANSIIRDTTLGSGIEVKANSMIDGALISDHCIIGPFARIRPGTVLADSAHIGNFVEIKKSSIGTGSKVNHLTYVGDSEIGKRVNVGAGTITCNYDGVNKHKTIIGDDAFIGSCTQLVAPVKVGEGATIGAGSTITQDAPANQLTLSRAEQRTIADWERPGKKAPVKG
jgi:bifunctional UDP-N-acetylglucosamine pyrophosphorylase/glucosamine-1-phosphate N-acetyltransferase